MRALAISIQREDGTSFLANSPGAQCWTTFDNEYGRRKAREERDECRRAGFRCRIVPIDITITERPSASRWLNPIEGA